MAIVVKDRDGTFAIKKLSKYDMTALADALWEGTDRRNGNGFAERLAEIAQLVDDSQDADKHGVFITKERNDHA